MTCFKFLTARYSSLNFDLLVYNNNDDKTGIVCVFFSSFFKDCDVNLSCSFMAAAMMFFLCFCSAHISLPPFPRQLNSHYALLYAEHNLSHWCILMLWPLNTLWVPKAHNLLTTWLNFDSQIAENYSSYETIGKCLNVNKPNDKLIGLTIF